MTYIALALSGMVFVVVSAFITFFIIGMRANGNPVYKCPKCDDNDLHRSFRAGVIPKCLKCGTETRQMPGKWVGFFGVHRINEVGGNWDVY